jgi:hypothetical protein
MNACRPHPILRQPIRRWTPTGSGRSARSAPKLSPDKENTYVEHRHRASPLLDEASIRAATVRFADAAIRADIKPNATTQPMPAPSREIIELSSKASISTSRQSIVSMMK